MLHMVGYYSDQIEQLKDRRQEMANLIVQSMGICESHVLLTTYLDCGWRLLKEPENA
nr:hypothetical protein [Streptococcus pyogenes]